MTPLRRQSRRFAAEWLALGFTLLVVAAVFSATLYRERLAVEAREADRLQTDARVIDENMSLQLEGASKALLGIGGELRRAGLVGSAPWLVPRLRLLTDAMAGVSSMLVLDRDGTVVAATLDELTGKNFSHREYFDGPRRHFGAAMLHVSPPFRTTRGNVVVVVSRAFVAGDGAFAGVVTATLDSNYFSGLLRSVLYAPDMETALVHRDGKVFLGSAGTPPPESRHAEPALAGHLASGALATLTRSADDDRLVAARTIERGELRLEKALIVSASRSLTAMYMPWWERVRQLAATSALLAFGAGLALLMNHRRRRTWAEAAEVIERERRVAGERVELALRGADLGLWDLHVPSGDVVVNARERALLGFGDRDPLPQGHAWRELIHPDDRACVDAAIVPHLRGDADTYGCELRMRHRSGHDVWLSSRGMIVERSADGAPLRIIGTHLDISERKRAEERLAQAAALLKASEERLSLALESSGLAMFDWDIAAGTMYHSAQAAVMRGEPAREITAPVDELRGFVHPADLPMVLAQLKAAVIGTAPLYVAEYRLRRGVDDWLWVRARGRVVQRDGAGRALRLAGTYTDINDARIAEGRLRRLAEFDALTGLPNRALFADRLQQAMKRAARGRPIALLFLDVDRFKSINDSHGHESGDKLLKVFAARMQGAVRQSDTVARLAGDEFTIILEQVDGATDACVVAAKLVQTLRQPIALAGHMCEVTASIGVAVHSGPDFDDGALLRRADAALYEAKRRGRDGFYCAEAETPCEPSAPLGGAALH